MLDPAIAAFFSERKAGWLKKNLKPEMTESGKSVVEKECEALFSLDSWLPGAAKRARQMSISTHPCTYSHPSARKNKNGYVTSIIAETSRRTDGLLRTGNTHAEADGLGNAAALDVYKFLSLIVEDGKTVLEHIQDDSELAKSLLHIKTESYESLKTGFLSMTSSDETVTTSSKIKQVFFPVDDGYHQLSILSNSGLIYELRKRIDELRFSDAIKVERDLRRKNQFSETGYREIYDIVTIGYGGTKPQNISVLNNQYGGKAHLLMSVPPLLEQRDVRFPTRDFFKQSLRYEDCRESFERLDNVFKIERDSEVPLDKVRKGRDRCLGDILDVILQKMTALREASISQFWRETNTLPSWQKLWLCEQHKEQRSEQNDWLNTLCEQIALWINNAYKNSIKHAVMLGEAERAYIREFILSNKEVLR